MAERFPRVGRLSMAAAVERSGRYLFLAGLAGSIAVAWLVHSRWYTATA